MRLLLPAWLLLGALCVAQGALVWGLLARLLPAFRLRPRWASLFWIGFATVTAELQSLSLFRRTDGITLALVSAIAAGGIPALRSVLRCRRGNGSARTWTRALLALIVTVVVAHAATGNMDWYDTTSTHLQQVKWAASYRALPGLGNLNGKLGFDQAHHLWAALAARGPLAGSSAHVVVGFLVWVTLLQWAWILTARAMERGAVRAKILAGLTLGFFAGKLASGEVPSLSGDLAMACLFLAGTIELSRVCVGTGLGAHRRTALAVFTAAAIGAAVFAIKWSALPFSLLCGLLLGAWAYRVRRTHGAMAWVPLVLPGLLVAVTLLRRIVLTGWALYPIPLGGTSLSFAMPAAEVHLQYDWIKSWARMPGADPAQVLGNGFFAWFVPWYARFRSSRELVLLAVAVGALCARPVIDRRAKLVPLLPLFGASACLVYWFVGAPDVRFGSCFFWALAACALLPHFEAGYAAPATRVLLLLCTVGAMQWNDGLGLPVPAAPRWDAPPPDPVRPTREELIDKARGRPLRVFVPNADLCGASPLPCTPTPQSFLPRRPGSLSQGFVAKP